MLDKLKKLILANNLRTKMVCIVLFGAITFSSLAQSQSVARKWNEVQLRCNEKSLTAPSILSRNMYHASMCMYDAYAIYNNQLTTVFLGQSLGDYTCEFTPVQSTEDVESSQEKAISYAMYRFITYRYQPNAPWTFTNQTNNWVYYMQGYVDGLMDELGYDTSITSIDYSDGDPAKLGNYIAFKMWEYGLQDGANEINNYANPFGQDANGGFFLFLPGNDYQYEANRWQRTSFVYTLDANGLPINTGQPHATRFWGDVTPFSLTPDLKTILTRDNHDWSVYLNPGEPPLIDTVTQIERQWDEDFFRWGFLQNVVWQSLLDSADAVFTDISPNSKGNIDYNYLPETFEEYKLYYNTFSGGVNDNGYFENPVTDELYQNNLALRTDYIRASIFFWNLKNNRSSLTRNWFDILNYVTDAPSIEKRWQGQGPILNDLEWDVRSYLALGASLHDAAVATFSVKGYYDYTRSFMSIRYMIDRGQCSDISLENYDPAGIPLIPGFVEIVEEGDELAGVNGEFIGEIKLKTFRGPIEYTGFDGAGWILGENYTPYMIYNFFPNYSGFASIQSAFSFAGARVLERITGSPYFPDGIGEFTVDPNLNTIYYAPLIDEVELQWVSYYDAANEASLSQIYGGITSPQDDIPGRKIGGIVGSLAFDKANGFMQEAPLVSSLTCNYEIITENLVSTPFIVTAQFSVPMNMDSTPILEFTQPTNTSLILDSGSWINDSTYQFFFNVIDANEIMASIGGSVHFAVSATGNTSLSPVFNLFSVDTKNPSVINLDASNGFITDETVQMGIYSITLEFDENMAPNSNVQLSFPSQDLSSMMTINSSNWLNSSTYQINYSLSDLNVTLNDIDVLVSGAIDISGNVQSSFIELGVFDVDTQNPTVAQVSSSAELINIANAGNQLVITTVFSEDINQESAIDISIGPNQAEIFCNLVSGSWINATTYQAVYNCGISAIEVESIEFLVEGVIDLAGNIAVPFSEMGLFQIDTKSPISISADVSDPILSDENTGLGLFSILVHFNDEMNENDIPEIIFNLFDSSDELIFDESQSGWSNGSQDYEAFFTCYDNNILIEDVDFYVTSASDNANNPILNSGFIGVIDIDTENPFISNVETNYSAITTEQIGSLFEITLYYSEEMDVTVNPILTFSNSDVDNVLSIESQQWLNSSTFIVSYTVGSFPLITPGINISIDGAIDFAGNSQLPSEQQNYFYVFLSSDSYLTEEFSVFPNPVRIGNDITVSMNSIVQNCEIMLVDEAGKVVRDFIVNSIAERKAVIYTNELAAGKYVLNIKTNIGSTTYQIVIQ